MATMIRNGKRVPLHTEVGGFKVGDRISAPWMAEFEPELAAEAMTGTVIPMRNKQHVTAMMDDGVVRHFTPKSLIEGLHIKR